MPKNVHVQQQGNKRWEQYEVLGFLVHTWVHVHVVHTQLCVDLKQFPRPVQKQKLNKTL